ncbi:acylphosphatase [Sphingomonas sp. PR090111-T3T-6A]|uniref:acylphosphatase n=1 Tax=Sphingomonas sp. PR090111-T3T-6A TaxID=685778 RepID=UPI000369ABE9|nr:acylphosphatase [Sphingomonas sp. PR090111-T3T-6A]
MPVITRHLAIHGRVQGVCYRDWAVRTATLLGISGWVRNRPDGSVEALAMGEAEAVEAFIARCRGGPSSARVDGIAISEAAPEPVQGFERRPTG